MTAHNFNEFYAWLSKASGEHSGADELRRLAEDSGDDELIEAVDVVLRAHAVFAEAFEAHAEVILDAAERLINGDSE